MIEGHSIHTVQFLRVAANKLQVGLHFEAGSAGAASELVEGDACRRIKIRMPEFFKMVKFCHLLVRGKPGSGRRGSRLAWHTGRFQT